MSSLYLSLYLFIISKSDKKKYLYQVITYTAHTHPQNHIHIHKKWFQCIHTYIYTYICIYIYWFDFNVSYNSCHQCWTSLPLCPTVTDHETCENWNFTNTPMTNSETFRIDDSWFQREREREREGAHTRGGETSLEGGTEWVDTDTRSLYVHVCVCV